MVFQIRLNGPPTHPLRPVIPDNARHLRRTTLATYVLPRLLARS